jgi:hypothetical protein
MWDSRLVITYAVVKFFCGTNRQFKKWLGSLRWDIALEFFISTMLFVW